MGETLTRDLTRMADDRCRTIPFRCMCMVAAIAP